MIFKSTKFDCLSNLILSSIESTFKKLLFCYKCNKIYFNLFIYLLTFVFFLFFLIKDNIFFSIKYFFDFN